MFSDIFCVIFFCTLHFIASSSELQPGMPNVCADQQMSMLGARQPCVQAFTRMVKVWKQGCNSHRWCMGYERRTAYYTVYRQVYNMDTHTAYKCCPGWRQEGEEMGCLHRVCRANTCFNRGQCAETGDKICQCPMGFKGTRCQYGGWSLECCGYPS
ncbi:hypothetical protein CgunFtcFv8_010282 [Champsocephalus gunnari]|uniref:Uncharacterized protein n=1 Tax=Champsocephalus gunnari TaxID=52237 RepID=A0AAN8DUJ8_CHAGU|nr:hypothetical protein CgunFtcFv8_010282 [Champsocephalus gunnari]